MGWAIGIGIGLGGCEVSAAEKIPWPQLALTADECAGMFGCTKRSFLESIACLPSFPRRVRAKPSAWIAGEVAEWRDANRADPPIRRQIRGNRASNS